MTEAFKWWPDPQSAEEVEPYVELLFTHAGQNLWTKILRPYVTENITKKLSEPKEEPKQG